MTPTLVGSIPIGGKKILPKGAIMRNEIAMKTFHSCDIARFLF